MFFIISCLDIDLELQTIEVEIIPEMDPVKAVMVPSLSNMEIGPALERTESPAPTASTTLLASAGGV